jgi:hypothetical protein
MGMTLILIGAAVGAFWLFYGSVVQKSFAYDRLYLSEMHGTSRTLWWDTHRYTMRLIGWQHDDFAMVGASATKEDVPWILDGPSGNTFDECGAGHRGSALEHVTNHSAGNTREKWLEWWDQHKNETQAEWIMQGFREFGLNIRLPLDHDAHLRLLSIIGKGTPDFSKKDWKSGVPDHIRFNASRLLRDTGFKLNSITQEEVGKDVSGDLLKGIIAHAGGNWPPSMAVPVFGKPLKEHTWPILSPWIGRTFIAASGLLMAFGWWLRRRKPFEASTATPASS